MRYVILGAGIAGLSAARVIRERDADGEIVMITTEQGKPYYRPMIPMLINGSKREADIELPDDPYRALRVNLSVRFAERLDTGKKTLYLQGSKKLAYDRLLIATGAKPAVPKIPGLSAEDMSVLRTRTDAEELGSIARNARRVVVIGGGMVGIKTATALRSLPDPPRVTIIEKEDHILPQRLDTEAASIIQTALEREGIAFHTGSGIKAARKGKQVRLSLGRGREVHADLVIAATGVRPNIDLLKRSGVKTRSGVLVDDQYRTSVRDVYAAGDVAECSDALTGRPFASALWTNAVEMGKIAGLNMAGGKSRGRDLLPVMNATEIAGVPLISAGIVEPGKKFEIGVTRENGSYRKVVMQENKVVGISFLGDIRNAGMYVNMIRNRTAISGDRDRFLRGMATYADAAVGGETA